MKPDSPMFEEARAVAGRLRRVGHRALFAGGCVRDLLLGIEPHDVDIATSATPEEVMALFPRTVAVGARFGVVLVLSGGFEFQVATFRSDGAYADGRHPATVAFSGEREDAERRDFTINGLFLEPGGEVLDYVGGRADLEAGVLRAIGDPELRFEEDRLRLLRAVRFAARFGLRVEERTWEAVRRAPERVLSVSAERIREELARIFTHERRLAGFDLLDASGLLAVLLPEVETLKGCEQPPEFHPEGDVFVHTRLMIELLPERVSVPLVFATLLHDTGKPETASVDADGRIRFNGHEAVSARIAHGVMERLRFSGAEIEATVEMVRHHMAFKDVCNMRTAKLKRFMARETFEDELELHRVDCLASHGLLDNHVFLLEKREAFANEPLIPPRLVTGQDLIAMGWKPGPLFKEALDAVQTQQLEGALKTREEALEWVRSQFGAG